MVVSRLPPLPVVIMRYVFKDGFSTRATAAAQLHLEKLLESSGEGSKLVVVRVNIETMS